MSVQNEFETWAKKVGFPLSKSSGGAYVYVATDSAYEAWKHQQKIIDDLTTRLEEIALKDEYRGLI